MPIRPINELIGRHLAVWFYGRGMHMPDYSMSSLMSGGTLAKLDREFDLQEMPRWIARYCETRDKLTADFRTPGKEERIYGSDILTIYNRTRRELQAMDRMRELGITGEDIGLSDYDFREYMENGRILDESRTTALVLAGELEDRDDFLFVFSKVLRAQANGRTGCCVEFGAYSLGAYTLQQWKEGVVYKALGRELEEDDEEAPEPEEKPVEKRGRKKLPAGQKKTTVGTILPSGLKESAEKHASDKGLSISLYIDELIHRRINNEQ